MERIKTVDICPQVLGKTKCLKPYITNLTTSLKTSSASKTFYLDKFEFGKKIKMAAFQAWVAEHKLTSIGAFWASAVGASLAYTRKRTPLKPSLRLIHARMHAQALTLAVLSGAALLHYYDSANHASADNDENYDNATQNNSA